MTVYTWKEDRVGSKMKADPKFPKQILEAEIVDRVCLFELSRYRYRRTLSKFQYDTLCIIVIIGC